MDERIEELSWVLRFRYATYTVRKWAYMSDEERKADFTRVTHEFMFNKRQNTDPGFYRKMKKDIAKVDWVQTHINELAYLIMLDLLHPHISTMKSAETALKEYRGISEERMTPRHRRTFLRNYYPEVFFTPPKLKINKVSDGRESHFSSIFNDLPLMDEAEMKDAMKLLNLQDLAFYEKFGDITQILKIHAGLRMVEPEDITSLRRFWLGAKNSLEAILEQYGQPEDDRYHLIKCINNRTTKLEVFFTLVEDAVALRWFRTKKASVKKSYVMKHYPLRYTREDAVKAVAENMSWFGNPVQVFDIISRGGDAYCNIGKFDTAIDLYEESLLQIHDMELYDVGLCHHNLSNCYKHLNKPRKALSELLKTMDIWKEMESQYDIGITWGYLGEIYHIQQRFEDSEHALKKSLEILNFLPIEVEIWAKGLLHVADCAARIDNPGIEVKALERAFEILSNGKELNDLLLYVSQRLIDINSGKKSIYAEREPGKIQHPDEFPWHSPTPETFIPLHPKRADKDKRLTR